MSAITHQSPVAARPVKARLLAMAAAAALAALTTPSFAAGWVQRWGGPVEETRPGDVVWIAPGVKHWHGAAAAMGMTHIAITEHLDGRTSEWMEKVGDEQYLAGLPAAGARAE